MAEYTITELEQHRRDWIMALRSGKYNQVQKVLANENGFCCLGIACVVAGNEKVYAHDIGCYFFYDEEDCLKQCGMPNDVIKYYGFIDEIGSSNLSQNQEKRSLVYLNDKENFTFEQIADHVESNMNLYFTNENAIDG